MQTPYTIKTVSIFSGYNVGMTPAFEGAARQLGRYLAEQNIRIMFSAARTGLVGALIEGALSANGEVVGVIPVEWLKKGRAIDRKGLSDLHVVGSLEKKKQVMTQWGDAYIAIPGGEGAFEDLFEAWTLSQIHLERKAVGLFNVGGFFNSLQNFLEIAFEHGFVQSLEQYRLSVEQTPEKLLDAMVHTRWPDTGDVDERAARTWWPPEPEEEEEQA